MLMPGAQQAALTNPAIPHGIAMVIADVGESLFAGADLHVHQGAKFLSPAYYTSMGFSVPAALGAGLADPSKRPIVLVGDGEFQMTGTELATCLRHGQTPIVLVLNNHGYSTEREIMDGPFNLETAVGSRKSA